MTLAEDILVTKNLVCAAILGGTFLLPGGLVWPRQERTSWLSHRASDSCDFPLASTAFATCSFILKRQSWWSPVTKASAVPETWSTILSPCLPHLSMGTDSPRVWLSSNSLAPGVTALSPQMLTTWFSQTLRAWRTESTVSVVSIFREKSLG